MAKRSRLKELIAEREPDHFYALPHMVVRSAEFQSLTPRATKLLFSLLAQFLGDNNGNLSAAWKVMKAIGWTSRDQLDKAIVELHAANFITVTKQGGKHKPTLYAVTFYAIHWCGGKLDLHPANWPCRQFLGSWRRQEGAIAATETKRAANRRAANVLKATIPLSRQAGQSANDSPARRVNSPEKAAERPTGRASQAHFRGSIDPPSGPLSRGATPGGTATDAGTAREQAELPAPAFPSAAVVDLDAHRGAAGAASGPTPTPAGPIVDSVALLGYANLRGMIERRLVEQGRLGTVVSPWLSKIRRKYGPERTEAMLRDCVRQDPGDYEVWIRADLETLRNTDAAGLSRQPAALAR